MTPVDALLVYITVGSEEEADRVTRALLDARLAACVNRVPGVHSRYWWRGAQETAVELLLLAKTRRELWPRLLETVRTHHSYDVFEAIAVPIVEANPDYLRWIAESTTEEQG